MRNIFQILLIAVTGGFFLAGCEKNLELELKDQGGRLVLFSFLSPDSVFKAHLSKSVSHFSVDDFERIYSGNITVSTNGEIVDNFIFPYDQNWASRDDLVVKEGDTIRIDASDGEGINVFGETVVPSAVNISLSDTSLVLVAGQENTQTEVLRCIFSIFDPVDVDNYYQLLIFEDICTISGNEKICKRTRIKYSKNDPVFYVRDQESSLIGGLDFGGCFSDHLFDGEYKLTLDLPVEYVVSPDSPGTIRKLSFVLLSHTRDYYDYYRSRIVAEYGYDLPVIDPIRIYNNVKGGLGLVSAYSASVDSLVFNGE